MGNNALIFTLCLVIVFIFEIFMAALFRRDCESLEIRIEDLYDEIEELQFRIDNLDCKTHKGMEWEDD